MESWGTFVMCIAVHARANTHAHALALVHTCTLSCTRAATGMPSYICGQNCKRPRSTSAQGFWTISILGHMLTSSKFPCELGCPSTPSSRRLRLLSFLVLLTNLASYVFTHFGLCSLATGPHVKCPYMNETSTVCCNGHERTCTYSWVICVV